MSTEKTPAKKVAAKKVAKKVAAKKVILKKVVPIAIGTKKEIVKKETAPKEIKSKKVITDPTEYLAWAIAQGMFERKAEDIKILDMRNVKSASTDFFVISHAESDKQVEAIARSVDEEVKKLTGEMPWHREGMENNEWVLLDYFNVVAHVFQREKREFYAVEELWGDAVLVEFKGK
ncbi:MAG: ribosome silencing factor [Bacteroidia bacterium]